MRELIEQGSRLLPTLANYSVTASYAGLRPANRTENTTAFSPIPIGSGSAWRAFAPPA